MTTKMHFSSTSSLFLILLSSSLNLFLLLFSSLLPHSFNSASVTSTSIRHEGCVPVQSTSQADCPLTRRPIYLRPAPYSLHRRQDFVCVVKFTARPSSLTFTHTPVVVANFNDAALPPPRSHNMDPDHVHPDRRHIVQFGQAGGTPPPPFAGLISVLARPFVCSNIGTTSAALPDPRPVVSHPAPRPAPSPAAPRDVSRPQPSIIPQKRKPDTDAMVEHPVKKLRSILNEVDAWAKENEQSARKNNELSAALKDVKQQKEKLRQKVAHQANHITGLMSSIERIKKREAATAQTYIDHLVDQGSTIEGLKRELNDTAHEIATLNSKLGKVELKLRIVMDAKDTQVALAMNQGPERAVEGAQKTQLKVQDMDEEKSQLLEKVKSLEVANSKLQKDLKTQKFTMDTLLSGWLAEKQLLEARLAGLQEGQDTLAALAIVAADTTSHGSRGLTDWELQYHQSMQGNASDREASPESSGKSSEEDLSMALIKFED